jgi:recombination protein RecT
MATPNQKQAESALPSSPANSVPPVSTTPALSGALQRAASGVAPAVVEDPSLQFKNFLEKHQRDFAMVAPSHIKPERIIRLALSVVRKDPKLLNCSLQSVIGGLMQAASLGLEVNSPLEQAYLIPFSSKKSSTPEAEFIIGYKGYIDLFYRSGIVDTVFAQPVFELDDFSFEYGTSEYIKHRPNGVPSERGKVIKFYSYARIRGAAYRFIVLDVAEVNQIRDEYSASYKNDPTNQNIPWNRNYLSMGCKTAVRSLEPFLPRSSEISRAVRADATVIDNPFEPANFDTGDATKNFNSEK